jgi:hypothetical protein
LILPHPLPLASLPLPSASLHIHTKSLVGGRGFSHPLVSSAGRRVFPPPSFLLRPLKAGGGGVSHPLVFPP